MLKKNQKVTKMNVYFKNNKGLKLFYFYIKIEKGSIDDPVGKEGLAHLAEHMIFSSLIKGKAFYEYLTENNIIFNARTTFDFIVIDFMMEKENFNFLLELIEKLKTEFKFKIENFNKEKEIVYEEIKTVNGNFSEKIFNNVFKDILGKKYLDDIILGSYKSIKNIDITDIIQFFSSANFSYYLFADYVEQDVVKVFPKYNLISKMVNYKEKYNLKLQLQNKILKINDKNNAVILVAKSSEKTLKNFVINEIILNYLANDDSILYNKLRKDEALSYSIYGTSNYLNGHSILTIMIETSDLQKVVEKIIEVFNGIKNNGLDVELFKKIKAKSRIGFLSQFEDLSIFDVFIEHGIFGVDDIFGLLDNITELEFVNLIFSVIDSFIFYIVK